MPKRRLHGETQKRRQKPAVRVLKLRDTIQRKHETRVPLPFEASPELESQDVEFLEAMRELRVNRLPGQGGAPVRQQAIQRAHFASDAENENAFAAAMRELRVKPLSAKEQALLDRKASPAEAEAVWTSEREGREPGRRDPRPPAAGQGMASLGEVAKRPERPFPATSPPPAKRPESSAPSGPTRFEEPENPREWMEEALRSGAATLSDKFEGAPQPKARKGNVLAKLKVHPDAEPEDELDLHGKTQDEAIPLVERFLLHAKYRRLRAVLIITGKGLNSGGQGPVLRGAVLSWLEHHGAPYLRGFAFAPARHGGDGALWVELA
jgi:DNA-nicking Smr family endonuclease